MVLFNRVFNYIPIHSLKGRLRFWFTILIVLLILLSSFPFLLVGKGHRENEAKASIEQMINLQQLVIENWFTERMADILTISSLPVVTSLDMEGMSEALEIFDSNHTDFSGIVYVNQSGITEIDTTGTPGLDVLDRIYFQEAEKGHTYVTDVLIGRNSNEPIIIFSSPIMDKENHFLGLVFGSVRLDTINQVMDQFQLSNSRDTYLVNREGMLITESKIGGFGQKIDTDIMKLALAGEPVYEKYTDSLGEMVLGDYRWVNDNKWLIIGEITNRDILTPILSMALALSVVILIILCIGFVFMIWISNQIEFPIRKVLEGTRKIGEGKFHYQLEPTSFKNNARELRELCTNFNKMALLTKDYIHSLKRTELNLRESEDRYRSILEYSSDMITLHDAEGNYLFVSKAGKDILQYEDEDFIGKSGYQFIHPDDMDTIKNNHEILLTTGFVVSTYRIRRKDGEYIWFESSIRCLHTNDGRGPQLIVVSRNITERKEVEQKLHEANNMLHKLSTKDGLTGIDNRRSFDEKIMMEWNRALRSSRPLSLIMLDIDFFKAYNDTYGHQQGDECLKQVATVIQATVSRSCDVVCRYGGEEFVIILPDTDEYGVRYVAEKIRIAIETLKIPHRNSKIEEYVTISLGATTLRPSHSDQICDFLEAADRALYQAKQEGRNRFKLFESISV